MCHGKPAFSLATFHTSINRSKGEIPTTHVGKVSVTNRITLLGEFIERCSHTIRDNSVQSSINRCIRSCFEFSLGNRNKAMLRMKIPVVVLILIAETCGGECLIPIPSQDESIISLVDDLVNIVTSCYRDRIYAVGIAGDVPDALLRTLSTRSLIPVVLMGERMAKRNSILGERASTFRTVPYALQVFIVEASSYDDLSTIIKNICNSIWWNHSASFFLLDRSRGCVKAGQLITAASISNLLNVKVMCYNHKDGRIIMTYNPYTNQAPVPWQRLNAGRNALFSREYRGNEEICVNLDFDTIMDLGGDEIPIQIISNIPGTENRRTKSFDRHLSKEGRILSIICRTLNLKPNFRIISRFDDTKFNGFLVQISSPLIIENRIVSTTYPHEQVTFVVVSKFRDYAPRQNKISLSILYLITLTVFKFFVSQTLMSAFRNLIGINCNSSSRIYLVGLLLVTIMIQSIYQSNLTFQLTERSPLKNVETQEDLVSLGYNKIYVYDNQDSVIVDPEARKRFVITKSNEDCYTLVMDDPAAACIWRSKDARHLGRQFGLHVSPEPFALMNYGIPIKSTVPYDEQINKILAKCAEAGILEPWPMQCNISYWNDFKFGTFGEKVEVKSIDFRELKSAFVILGIGLACATVTLILELVIKYKCIFV